jgi:hypothetical protein
LFFSFLFPFNMCWLSSLVHFYFVLFLGLSFCDPSLLPPCMSFCVRFHHAPVRVPLPPIVEHDGESWRLPLMSPCFRETQPICLSTAHGHPPPRPPFPSGSDVGLFK